jgi:hypothetical protein
MAYAPKTWIDRVVQYVRRYKDQSNVQYTFTPDEGTITAEGTPVTAADMNHLEQGIVDLETADGLLAPKESPILTVTVSGLANPQYTGITAIAPMAGSCAVYDLLYPTSTGYQKAKSNATSTMPCVAMCLETGTGSRRVLLRGVIRYTTWNWTVGAPIYVDAATAGAMTQTMPTTGNQVQPIGYAIDADTIDFNPPYLYAERV